MNSGSLGTIHGTIVARRSHCFSESHIMVISCPLIKQENTILPTKFHNSAYCYLLRLFTSSVRQDITAISCLLILKRTIFRNTFYITAYCLACIWEHKYLCRPGNTVIDKRQQFIPYHNNLSEGAFNNVPIKYQVICLFYNKS